MEFEGWKLKRVKDQIECRKQIGTPFKWDCHITAIQGQVLLIVAKDGWQLGKRTGDNEVRLSMNNPCGMSLDELEGFVRVAKHARSLLEVNDG